MTQQNMLKILFEKACRVLRVFIAAMFVCAFFACTSATAAFAKTRVFIVQGLAGEDYYQRHFDEQIEQIKTASEKLGSEQDVKLFSADLARAENILPELAGSVEQMGANDQFILYLIGHGSYDGRDYKFNLVGPDISGSELLEVLNSNEQAGAVTLVNTSSSSGALLEIFEQSSVNLITATKSGAERTATRFGRHLADGLSGDADINKNQSISLQEAFDFAVSETEEFYEAEGLLATENARLQIASAGNAAQLGPDLIKLTSLIEQQQTSDPKLIELYSQRDDLDGQIDSLRLRRTSMTEEDYLGQFQNLMIELSILQFEIDGALTGSDSGGSAE